MATCRSCGARIDWAKTEAGKAIPLDSEPVICGNIEVENGIARVVAVDGTPRHVSHFSTCPQAKKWRSR